MAFQLPITDYQLPIISGTVSAVVAIDVLAMAAGLGMDAMSVSMGIGVRWHGPRQKFRLAWHMGLFQFLMPVLGWFGGRQLAGPLQAWGGYVSAALVIGIGAKMMWEAIRSRPGGMAQSAAHWEQRHMHHRDPTRGWSLVIISVATSMDALVVGFSLALKGESIWLPSVAIGVVTAGMALAGVVIGKRLGRRLGRYAEIGGAAVLIALGVSFIWI